MSLIVKGGGGKPEEEKTIKPTTSVQNVTPSSGKHLSKVIVEACNKVTIDGVKYNEDLDLKESYCLQSKAKMWDNFYDYGDSDSNCAACGMNGEIYAIRNKYFKKLSGDTWETLASLPYSLNGYNRGLESINGEIHCTSASSSAVHYKYKDNAWTRVGNGMLNGKLLNFRGELHLIAGSNSSSNKAHWKWNGTNWIDVTTTPVSMVFYNFCVFNDEIHAIYSGHHYKFNGTSWTLLNDSPPAATSNENNFALFSLGSELNCAVRETENMYIYKLVGDEWVKDATFSINVFSPLVVIIDNAAWFIGGTIIYKSTNVNSNGYNNFKLFKGYERV